MPVPDPTRSVMLHASEERNKDWGRGTKSEGCSSHTRPAVPDSDNHQNQSMVGDRTLIGTHKKEQSHWPDATEHGHAACETERVVARQHREVGAVQAGADAAAGGAAMRTHAESALAAAQLVRPVHTSLMAIGGDQTTRTNRQQRRGMKAQRCAQGGG